MDIIERSRAAGGGADEDVRVLHKLEVKEGFTGEGDDENASVCLVLDTETTGLDHEADAVIQLAMRRLRYDGDGVVTRIGAPFSWFEDPGRPIAPEITSLTGIRDEDVAGRRFPDEDIVHALKGAAVIVAHNASFDRKWIERRFPEAAGLGWACSMADIDWGRRGFDGCKLGFLGVQCGFFFDAHRADADVDAVIALLSYRFEDGRTAMAVMIESAEAAS